MNKTGLKHVSSRSAICTALGLGVALPFSAWAQNQTGGMFLELKLGEQFTTRNVSGPDAVGDGVSNRLITDLDLAFSSETRTEAVTLDFGAGYQFYDGPTTDGYEGDFTNPTLRLSYAQTATAASFAINATATQVTLADVSVFNLDDDGLVQDFASLEDGGTRTQLGFSSTLSIRDDAPFGLIFGISGTDISYSDLPSDSTLADNRSGRFSTTARFDISEVLQARVGLNYRISETDGADRFERYGLSTSASLALPDGGAYTLSGSFDNGDGSAQNTLRVGRSFATEFTEVSFIGGVTHAGDDSVYLTGSADFEHDFGDESPFGPFTASAGRNVTFDSENDEQIVTSLALAGSYALSPQATLRMTGNLAQSEDVSSGETVDLAQAALSLGYTFDRNWQGSASLSGDLRDPSYEAATETATFSLGVTRSFDMRR